MQIVLGMLKACLAGIMLHQLASQYETRSETNAKVSVPFYVRGKMVSAEQCVCVSCRQHYCIVDSI